MVDRPDDFDDDHDDAGNGDDGPEPSATDEAVARGMEAFQTAAGELIAAARAMLDVAEGLVQDPHAASTVMRTIGSMAQGVTRFAAQSDRTPDRGVNDDDDDGGVRRIPVS